jgi:Recombination directionality factor-like
MAILDLQRRGQQIGRLRMGEQVGTGKFGQDGREKMRPVRRETWRLTTGSRHTADAAAERYGSEVRPWNGQWDVDTKLSEISVTVPPRDAVISQHYEMWTAGGCARRCDSQHEQVSGGPCLCPHAEDPSDAEEAARQALRRAGLARKNPPQACHLITRVNFMIPDLPGLGVFRLDTSSYYAAVEIGDAAMLMQAARDQGVFLPAILRIDQRQRTAGGETKKYPVPVLEITSTFRQIASGELAAGGVAAQLPPAPGGQRRAIGAVPPPARPSAAQFPPEALREAQEIADAAGAALTAKAVRGLIQAAKSKHLEAAMVNVGGVLMSLKDALTDAWNLAGEGAGS